MTAKPFKYRNAWRDKLVDKRLDERYEQVIVRDDGLEAKTPLKA